MSKSKSSSKSKGKAPTGTGIGFIDRPVRTLMELPGRVIGWLLRLAGALAVLSVVGLLGVALFAWAWPLISVGIRVGGTVAVFVGVVFLTSRTRVGGYLWWGLVDLYGFVTSPFHGRELPEPVSDGWATIETALARVLVKAGKVKLEEGQPLPHLKLIEATDDGHARTMRVGLPEGVMFSTFEALTPQIAVALRTPTARVTITRHPDDADDRAVITVKAKYVPTIRPWVRPTGTTWVDSILVGRDHAGRDLTIPTHNIGQILIGGMPGSGKTTLLKIIAAHYATDPDALLYVVDGKGDVDDWGPLKGRCEQLILARGDDTDAPRLMAFLGAVDQLVIDRNATSGRDYPGTLVMLEEFSNLLDGLPTAAYKEAVKKVGRIAKAGRSANVQVVVAVQRAAAEDIPTSTRANAKVRVSLSGDEAAYAKMILGHYPTDDLPTQPGEAIIKGAAGVEGDRPMTIDKLDDGQWVRFCTSLPTRAPTYTPGPETVVFPTVDDTQPVQDDQGLPHTPAPVRPSRPVYVPTGRRGVGVDAPTMQPSHSVPDVAPEPAKAPDARGLVLAALVTADAASTIELVKATGKARRTVGVALAGLYAADHVESAGYGKHRLTDTGKVEAAS